MIKIWIRFTHISVIHAILFCLQNIVFHRFIAKRGCRSRIISFDVISFICGLKHTYRFRQQTKKLIQSLYRITNAKCTCQAYLCPKRDARVQNCQIFSVVVLLCWNRILYNVTTFLLLKNSHFQNWFKKNLLRNLVW